MNIALLEKNFTARGFDYHQEYTTKSYYIYSLTLSGSNAGCKTYEVIKRSVVPICIDFEKKIFSDTEFKESFPRSNEAGGNSVWFFKNLDKAMGFVADREEDTK